MAQYDVFAIAGSNDLFLELQANRVQGISTRVGVPLVRKAPSDKPIPRLQPTLVVRGQVYIMLTQHIFSLPAADLRERLDNISGEDYRITSALDLLFHGI
jgi:toxin CcdB